MSRAQLRDAVAGVAVFRSFRSLAFKFVATRMLKMCQSQFFFHYVGVEVMFSRNREHEIAVSTSLQSKALSLNLTSNHPRSQDVLRDFGRAGL